MSKHVVESPWVYVPEGNVVLDSEGNRIADVRGWGHLTGTGGLRLSEEEAVKVQEARGVMLAAAPVFLAALKEVAQDRDFVVRCNDYIQGVVRAAIAKGEVK